MSMQSARILVVDDSPTVRRLAELILSQEGCTVHSAEDGDKGLEIARRVDPDVILVDYVMPKMNGHSFCKEIRSTPGMEDIPLILISSKGEAVGQSFEEEFGVIDYFSKPFEPDDLVHKLKEVLEAHPRLSRQSKATRADQAEGLSEACSEELLDRFQERFDKLVRQYFQKDFPLLMKNVLSDTLRENGVIKTSSLIFSGNLAKIPLPDIINFAGNSRLSGRLSVFSREVFGEIFLDEGMFVFATVSRNGASHFLTDLIRADGRISEQDIQMAVKEGRERNISIGRVLVEKSILDEADLMKYLQRHAQDAFNGILEVQNGHFFLEEDDLPANLQDVSFRIPLTNALLEGLRQLDEKQLAISEFSDEDMVLVRLITNEDALEGVDLGEKELLVFAIVDGRKTLREIIQLSGLEPAEVKRICYALRRVGLLRPKTASPGA